MSNRSYLFLQSDLHVRFVLPLLHRHSLWSCNALRGFASRNVPKTAAKISKHSDRPYPNFETGAPSSLFGGREQHGLGYQQNGWWEFYVRGENPDYPMRKRAFEYLWNRGVDVYRLSVRDIEHWTKWIEIKNQNSNDANGFSYWPQFPGDVTLAAKLKEAKRRATRFDPEWIESRLRRREKLNEQRLQYNTMSINEKILFLEAQRSKKLEK